MAAIAMSSFRERRWTHYKILGFCFLYISCSLSVIPINLMKYQSPIMADFHGNRVFEVIALLSLIASALILNFVALGYMLGKNSTEYERPFLATTAIMLGGLVAAYGGLALFWCVHILLGAHNGATVAATTAWLGLIYGVWRVVQPALAAPKP